MLFQERNEIMLNKKVVDLLNLQVNREFYSAYLYLDMANYYEELGYDGFANWFVVQAQEERDHAMGFIKYLQHVGAKVELDAIAKPNIVFKDLKDPLVEALKHEQFVTASINTIYEAAIESKDYLTQQFLRWYIMEQGEEEKNANDNILLYDNAGGSKGAILQLNHQFKSRTYEPSFPDLD